MTKKQFAEALTKLDVLITHAGEVLGVSERQAIRYQQGTSKIPGPVGKLLKLALAKKLTADEPTPLMPDAHEKTIREVPRDSEIAAIFKQIAGAGPLPSR